MKNTFSDYCLTIAIVFVIPSTTGAHKNFVCTRAHSISEGYRERQGVLATNLVTHTKRD